MDKKIVQFDEKKKKIVEDRKNKDKIKSRNQKIADKMRGKKSNNSLFIKGMIGLLVVSFILTLIRFIK